jgi:DNA-binding response OmpR family regulator
MSEPLIITVDDDIVQLTLLQRTLSGKAQVKQFLSTEEMLEDGALPQAHLVILDWDFPGMNGLDALRLIRAKHNVPVLFLTSFNTESKIVAALSSGADDFLVKPFRPAELMARIQVLLRRYHNYQSSKNNNHHNSNNKSHSVYKPTVLQPLIEGVTADPASLTLTLPGQAEIKLSNKEFALAVLFFQNVGRALPRDEIAYAVWGREEDVSSRTLDTHVSRLRTRLNLRPQAGWRLTPVYSIGYRLDIADDGDVDESYVKTVESPDKLGEL